MSLALKEAWKFQILTLPNPPVGCVITKNNMILSISAHKKYGSPHAEVNAIKQAYYNITQNKNILSLENSQDIHNFLYTNHNNIFKECFLYTTLEPCNHYGKTPPCSLLIKKLGFKKVIIGVKDTNNIASGGIDLLNKENIKISYAKKEESLNLIYGFQKYLKSQLIFFKYASTINGVIKGGYLSCDKSLDDVHILRDKCDLLVIGGNTVRTDKPTLDARRVNGKSPDILIYSNSKDFDKNIPLFKIKNRKVFISNNLDLMKNYKCIMIEGGENMLKSIKNKIDYFLLYLTPKISNRENIQSDFNLRFLNYEEKGKDIKIWALIP
jgi:diaminohydroxyphosphoribosylaminopyrimidine deaminase/5-amino-6-(5-phosphoribosylamino)uracil reductase